MPIQEWVKEDKPPVKMTFRKVGRKPSSNTVESQVICRNYEKENWKERVGFGHWWSQ